jgi:hypothetical protein
MHADWLFLKTLEDLEKKVQSKDAYDTLMIAFLVRRLLLDSTPLMDHVNRRRKIKIRFTVSNNLFDWDEDFLAAESADDILPGSGPGEDRIITRDQFLAEKVMLVDMEGVGRHVLTIKDVIELVAYVDGGVHLRDPDNEKEKAVGSVRRIIGPWSRPPPGHPSLQAIGKVVLQALQPLREDVMKRWILP